jgi:hypothetical protein
MVVLKNPRTGETREIDGEIPFGAIYRVEGFDEETGEPWDEDRVDLDGESWIVVDGGVDMVTTGSASSRSDSE